MGISLQLEHYSSLIILHSSLLFGNDEVVRDAELSAVVGKIRELVKR